MTTLVHPAVVEYLAGLSHLPHPELDVVAREGRAERLPIVYPETGALLHALVRLSGARQVLEIGTAIGYSTLWIATALPADGQVISLERDAERAARARAHATAAGFGERIHVMIGDASRLLHKLAGPFDVAGSYVVVRLKQRKDPDLKEFEAKKEELERDAELAKWDKMMTEWSHRRCMEAKGHGRILVNRALLRYEDGQEQSAYEPCATTSPASRRDS